MTDGALFDINAYGMPADEEPEPPASAPEPEAATPLPADIASSAPTSLYRKYRPQSFDSDDLFGQDHVVNTLRNAIALDRIAHAYLFCGPRGTGKTTTARILAKAVNCLDPDPHTRPCNVCANCVAINSGATTDVIEIDAASNRGIDDIRDLRDRVRYAPTQLKTKFYIIDEAHQITGAAANAFLKTLEEPPAHTKFILATTDPEDLLQTIVSRCQRFDFRRIPLDAMVANLTKIARAEQIDIDDDAKLMIARHATGSLRDAQGLLDQVAVYREHVDDASPRITTDLVRTVLGVSRNDRVAHICAAIADQQTGQAVQQISEAVEAGDDIRQLARQLLAFLRDMLLHRAGGTSDLDEAGKALAERFELNELAELTRHFGEIDFKVKHATISQLPLEIAVIQAALRTTRGVVAQAQPQAPAQQPPSHYTPPTPVSPGPPDGARPRLQNRVRGAGRTAQPPTPTSSSAPPRPEAAPEPTPPRQPQPEPDPQRTEPVRTPEPPPAPSSGGGMDLAALRDQWRQIKNDVKSVNRRIEALLQQTEPVAISGKQITLVSEFEFHRNRINHPDVRPVIEDVIARYVGGAVAIHCLTREEAAVMPPPQAAPRQAAQPIVEPPAPEPTRVTTYVKATPADDEEPLLPRGSNEPAPGPDLSKSILAIKNIFDAEDLPDDD